VSYPDAWKLLLPGEPTLEIVNFPPSHRVRAVILPPNGALINIAPPQEGVTTIDEWIKRDSAITGTGSRSTIVLLGARSKEPLNATETVSQSLEGQETVSCYFEIPGHILTGNLIYWKGDPKAGQYRHVLHEVIENVRPLEH